MAVSDQVVDIWNGAPMTTVSEEVAHSPLDGGHYGAKIEVPSVLPGFISGLLPWLDHVQYKELLLDMRQAFAFIVLGRDKGSGSITLDSHDGNPRVHYPLEPHDRASLMHGLVTATRIAAACGATQLGSSFSSMGLRDIPAVLVSGTREEIEESERQRASVVETLVQDMKRHGVTTDYKTLLFSAHQMGTCKMGSGRTTSVVDEHGETWGCSNLFVCDASVFPTSSGVNPM